MDTVLLCRSSLRKTTKNGDEMTQQLPTALRRAICLIDGSNNHAACRAVGINLDWHLIRNDMLTNWNAYRLSYYTATYTDDDNYNVLRPLLDWLEFNGYTVVQKPAKEYVTDKGVSRLKGNVDMEIAVDAMRAIGNADHVIIFTGDGDFKYLVDALKQAGIYVTIVSTLQGQVLSGDLRRVADNFVDLADCTHWQKIQDQPDKQSFTFTASQDGNGNQD